MGLWESFLIQPIRNRWKMKLQEIFDYLEEHPNVALKVDFPTFVKNNWIPIDYVKPE